jgi:hypothetical protein
MRIAPVLILLALAAGRAHADDDAPVAQPMKPVANADEICASMRGSLDAKLPCKKISSTKLAGATLEAYVVADQQTAQYATVMVVNEKSFVSPPLVIELGDCAMMKCLIVDKTTPRVHAVSQGALGVLELAVTLHWQHTNPDNGKVSNDKPRHNHYVIACSKGADVPSCITIQSGTMTDKSCTGSVDAGGELHTTCDETQYLSVP